LSEESITDILIKLSVARDLIDALDELLVCYRIGKRPSEKLLNRIPILREQVGGQNK
jgi:hypothetical protein